MAAFLHYLIPILVLIEVGHSSPHMGHEHEHDHHSGHKKGPTWDHKEELKKMTGVDLKWNISDPEWIVMEMSSKTNGYVSVGFCSKWVGSMKGCDIVLGWVDDETGKVTLTDYHANANDIPIIDESQDYELISGKQENHATTIRFRRKWRTNDDNDAHLGVNPVQIIYAWHPVDPLNATSFLPHDKNTRSHTTKMISMKPHQEANPDAAVVEHHKSESPVSILISIQCIVLSLIVSNFIF